MSFLRRLLPTRLAPQLILLLLAALILAQTISFFLLDRERQFALANLTRDNALWRSVAMIKLIETTPSSQQRQLLQTLSNRRTQMSLSSQAIVRKEDGDKKLEGVLERYLQQLLNERRQTRVAVVYQRNPNKSQIANDPPFFTRHSSEHKRQNAPWRSSDGFFKDRQWLPLDGLKLYTSVKLKDGRWLNMVGNFRIPQRSLTPIMLPMGILAVMIILIVWFSINRLTKPLRTLATAANDLGRGVDVEPLPEAGPEEVRAATRSFNEMQERLTRFVSDRTRMLAAISHDLRTPITSLRIRAEFIEDDEDRERMIATLDEMRAMVEETLSFTRDDSQKEEVRKVDLGGLIESLADDLQDQGQKVEVDDHARVVLECRPTALKRAFQNLICNAVRYGEEARVRVTTHDAFVEVVVQDKGPGIPEEKLQEVFEPFVRLEESRNEETGGIGLGLAITRSIIHGQGGTIDLENAPEGGLKAIVRLPR